MFLHQFLLLLLFLRHHPKSYLNVDRMPMKTRQTIVIVIQNLILLTWRRPRNSRSLRIFTQTLSSRLNRTRSSGSSTDVEVGAACIHEKKTIIFQQNNRNLCQLNLPGQLRQPYFVFNVTEISLFLNRPMAGKIDVIISDIYELKWKNSIISLVDKIF